ALCSRSRSPTDTSGCASRCRRCSSGDAGLTEPPKLGRAWPDPDLPPPLSRTFADRYPVPGRLALAECVAPPRVCLFRTHFKSSLHKRVDCIELGDIGPSSAEDEIFLAVLGDQQIVAGVAEKLIESCAAGDRVVAIVAGQIIVARAAVD